MPECFVVQEWCRDCWKQSAGDFRSRICALKLSATDSCTAELLPFILQHQDHNTHDSTSLSRFVAMNKGCVLVNEVLQAATAAMVGELDTRLSAKVGVSAKDCK